MINLKSFLLFLLPLVFLSFGDKYSQNNSERVHTTKENVMIKLTSDGDWVSMLNTCIENGIGNLAYIQIVEESPSYIIENISTESGNSFVANYTIDEVVTPISLTPIFFALEHEENFNFETGYVREQLNELDQNQALQNLYGEFPSIELNSYIVSTHIENIPDVCNSIVQMVEETIRPLDEQMEEMLKEL